MKKRHIFNRTFTFGISAKAIIASAIIAAFPVVAMAGPIVAGIGFSNVGVAGHNRPGVKISAGSLFQNDVIASGSATFARGYYGMNAGIGKLLFPTSGPVSVEPYISAGFLNLNPQASNPQGAPVLAPGQHILLGMQKVTRRAGAPLASASPGAVQLQDFYGLAGVNLNVPIGNRFAMQFGGGFGRTITASGGNGGLVYKGVAKAGFLITHRVTASANVTYLHVPGASLMSTGAGLSYQFS
jgi:hypothetical protein